jgi:hypothetical protein
LGLLALKPHAGPRDSFLMGAARPDGNVIQNIEFSTSYLAATKPRRPAERDRRA